MENEIPKSPEQVELEAAAQRLTEAKQAVARRERMLLDKAAADIAAHRAAEEAKLVEQRREIERIEKLHAERKAKQAETELREKQAQAAEQQRLEMEFNARQEQVRKREEHDQFLKQIAETAFALEQEEQRLAAELLRDTPLPAEDRTYTTVIPEATCNDDSQGRARLFSKILAAQKQHQTLETAPKLPVLDEIPEEYTVREGRIDPRVFASRFSSLHRGNLFLSPSSGDLLLNGYRWKVGECLSTRVWQHGCEIYIALAPHGYELRKIGSSERVDVTPVGAVEGVLFEPLSAAVEDEPLMCEAPLCSMNQ